VDRSKSNYTLEVKDSKRHPTFHVSNVKKYLNPHLELFPNRQRRQPRISPAEQDLNIEIEKIIGHERQRNDVIRFLCKWEGFPNEDATYRNASDFKSSPYGIQLVKTYVLDFGECPEELRAWVKRTEWIRNCVQDEWMKRGEVLEASLSVFHVRLELRDSPRSRRKLPLRRRGKDVGFYKYSPSSSFRDRKLC